MIVYRGEKSGKISKKGIWVTEDKGFAKEYGRVRKYLMPDDLNMLDATSGEANDLFNEYYETEGDDSFATDIWYQPSIDFIKFLKSKGYDGFQNEDNILVFDSNKLI